MILCGSTNVKFTDLCDSVGCVDADRVEWKSEDFGDWTEINGHKLVARWIPGSGVPPTWIGTIDGEESCDRADNQFTIQISLLEKVAL